MSLHVDLLCTVGMHMGSSNLDHVSLRSAISASHSKALSLPLSYIIHNILNFNARG